MCAHEMSQNKYATTRLSSKFFLQNKTTKAFLLCHLKMANDSFISSTAMWSTMGNPDFVGHHLNKA